MIFCFLFSYLGNSEQDSTRLNAGLPWRWQVPRAALQADSQPLRQFRVSSVEGEYARGRAAPSTRRELAQRGLLATFIFVFVTDLAFTEVPVLPQGPPVRSTKTGQTALAPQEPNPGGWFSSLAARQCGETDLVRRFRRRRGALLLRGLGSGIISPESFAWEQQELI